MKCYSIENAFSDVEMNMTNKMETQTWIISYRNGLSKSFCKDITNGFALQIKEVLTKMRTKCIMQEVEEQRLGWDDHDMRMADRRNARQVADLNP
jgi:hypothetical protein